MFGTNGHVETGTNGCLEHNGHFGANGTLGSMSFGPSGRWGQMCTWGKWAPGKMSTRVNRQLGHNGHFEEKGYLGQISVERLWGLGQMSIGTDELWGKWALGANGH